MERKVFTYKDVEEAKKYIGKPGRFSENLFLLEKGPDGESVGVLKHVGTDGFPFQNTVMQLFQFFSPDPEPVEKWVPFTAEDWELFHLKPVKNNNWTGLCAATVLGWTKYEVEIVDANEPRNIDFEEFLHVWTFLDGSPCGKKVTE